MVPAANLLAFGLASIPLIVIPGQSVLFTIGRSLSLGKVGGLVTVLGNSLGALVITVAIAFGLGTILESSAVVFHRGQGARRGVHHVPRGAGDPAPEPGKHEPVTTATERRRASTFWEGFLVGVSNVKTMIFFLAVFPLFVDQAAGRGARPDSHPGAVFIAIALVSDSTWALIAGSARDWSPAPARIPTLAATGGVMMIGIGAAVLLVGHGPVGSALVEHGSCHRRDLDADAVRHQQRDQRRPPIGREFDGGAFAVDRFGAHHGQFLEVVAGNGGKVLVDGGGDIRASAASARGPCGVSATASSANASAPTSAAPSARLNSRLRSRYREVAATTSRMSTRARKP